MYTFSCKYCENGVFEHIQVVLSAFDEIIPHELYVKVPFICAFWVKITVPIILHNTKRLNMYAYNNHALFFPSFDTISM